jgi:hypothetical protein
MCLQTRDRLSLSLLETRYSATHTCSSAGRAKKCVVDWPESLAMLLFGVLFGVDDVEATIVSGLSAWRGAIWLGG